jgi:hypothetical protein
VIYLIDRKIDTLKDMKSTHWKWLAHKYFKGATQSDVEKALEMVEQGIVTKQSISQHKTMTGLC